MKPGEEYILYRPTFYKGQLEIRPVKAMVSTKQLYIASVRTDERDMFLISIDDDGEPTEDPMSRTKNRALEKLLSEQSRKVARQAQVLEEEKEALDTMYAQAMKLFK